MWRRPTDTVLLRVKLVCRLSGIEKRCSVTTNHWALFGLTCMDRPRLGSTVVRRLIILETCLKAILVGALNFFICCPRCSWGSQWSLWRRDQKTWKVWGDNLVLLIAYISLLFNLCRNYKSLILIFSRKKCSVLEICLMIEVWSLCWKPWRWNQGFIVLLVPVIGLKWRYEFLIIRNIPSFLIFVISIGFKFIIFAPPIGLSVLRK